MPSQRNETSKLWTPNGSFYICGDVNNPSIKFVHPESQDEWWIMTFNVRNGKISATLHHSIYHDQGIMLGQTALESDADECINANDAIATW